MKQIFERLVGEEGACSILKLIFYTKIPITNVLTSFLCEWTLKKNKSFQNPISVESGSAYFWEPNNFIVYILKMKMNNH